MKWFALLYLFVCTGHAEESNFTFTYEMASRCKQHICQRGYSYDIYYSVTTELSQTTASVQRGVVLEMHLAIQAGSNGHILLSHQPFPSFNDPVYEIVVGGGGNKFTELRRNLKRNAKISKQTDKILSAVELRGFYIIMYSNGSIFFGPEGSPPLLHFVDIYPLDIEYFSFAAWNGVEAKFLYDCPPPGQLSGSNRTYVHNSSRIERNLSASDQLKRDKLQDRPSHMPPLPTVPVSVEARISSVSFNAFEAKLTTRMTLLTLWYDQGLAWNPDRYNGLTNVTYKQGQIWRPTLHVYNSDNLNALKTTGYELISMKSDGAGSFHFKASVETWCFAETTTYNRWPRDDYKCTIVIQPWEAHETIVFTTPTSDDTMSDTMSALADEDEAIENEWQLTRLRQSVVSGSVWNSIYPLQSNITHQSDRLVIRLSLQRKPTNYNIAFYTPLIVLMTFILMSFWGDPLQMSRVWFYAGASVFISAGLCFIDYLIPCHTIPTVLILYITALEGVLAALIIHVMMMTSLAEKVCKTVLMQNLLSASWFRALFCLPMFKMAGNYNRVNDGYSQQEDDEISAPISPNGNVEEMRTEPNKTYSEKEVLAVALDKTMFVVYSVLFAAMLAAHY